ncbi:MAG: DUF5684 domain-containing protein [Myxococcaceae bacterium]
MSSFRPAGVSRHATRMPPVGFFTITSGYVFLAALTPALWRIFAKAGRPGWSALFPLYNLVLLCEIAARPSWFAALLLVPVINIPCFIWICLGLATQFGKRSSFALGLSLLAPVFFSVLAFGDAPFLGERPYDVRVRLQLRG